MPTNLVSYLVQRPDTATFLLPSQIPRVLEELFRSEMLLPNPIKIFPADETQPPTLGFPVAETEVLHHLEILLDRWINEEVAWSANPDSSADKDKLQGAFSLYVTQLMKLAENAMMANLLSDYHAIFWLAHSFDVARHFSTIPRRVSAHDSALGRTQGDMLKYRIYGRWAVEVREQMNQLAGKAAAILEGEEQRAGQFFRLLMDDVLIFTEEFIGPDLRELRSFVTGWLRRDFQSFRDGFERMRATATDLLQRDRTFRASLALFGAAPDQGITLALLLDSRFQTFFFDHPAAQSTIGREEREQFQLLARRLREFAVLNQLRRAIVWMTEASDGRIASTDRRGAAVYSRSTRPMDFGNPGVVDPMVHRFGLIYDISRFSETLGSIRRGGRKEEVGSYRQMLLFQRRLESIAGRHLLQFEKFLGDGAFYTTRRAVRLIRAAVEIQRFYSEMKRKGFAFNKGLRIALNYGYYRLLPMKVGTDTSERITEFYGPGIVELSRLTTGKATREIGEIAGFLVSNGYDPVKVQQFFAPLSRGVDIIDHAQHAREFFAYINASGNLVNEGIVASLALLKELSTELSAESQRLYRIRAPFGSYIGFSPAVAGVEYAGVRLIGTVALKGLDQVEVGEIVPFAPGDVEAVALESAEPLIMLLRQDYHQKGETLGGEPLYDEHDDATREREVPSELVICARSLPDSSGNDEVLIGEWNPLSDDVRNPLRIPRGDFQRLFSLKGELSAELLSARKATVREVYERLCEKSGNEALHLSAFRLSDQYVAFVVGDIVEQL
ncbi:MAG TPA: hypothetical protein VEZ11_12700 [Thermoanaerobaculia bacterium]|nr:hypothetical protein [Thermoanaerobaculia bacterium]